MTEPRLDLTRWNRAGKSRFDYVDGNAAVWLERLREILTGLYARGVDPEMRSPDALRDLFLDETSDLARSEVDVDALRDALVWQRLADGLPSSIDGRAKLETRGQRGLRISAQYGAASDGDYAWDILRAFARATHVTLGHLDAYANEGYLRTATQWDNLRRLASLVNYQPTPAASASALVALDVKPELDTVEILPGLGMKHMPATGKPLVFETLTRLLAHPALNEARVSGWERNARPVAADRAEWLNPDAEAVAPGELVIVSGGGTAEARSLSAVTDLSDAEDETVLMLDFNRALTDRPALSDTRLWRDPASVLRPVARGAEGKLVVELETPGAVQSGDIVEIQGAEVPVMGLVLEREEDRATLSVSDAVSLPEDLKLAPLTPLSSIKSGVFQSPSPQVDRVFFAEDERVVAMAYQGAPDLEDRPNANGLNAISWDSQGVERVTANDGATVGYMFTPASRQSVVFMRLRGEKFMAAQQVQDPRVLGDASANVASFRGARPKGLTRGARFISRHLRSGALQALKVNGLRQDKGKFHVEFDTALDNPRHYEFIGPMRQSLRPVGHDRNPDRFGNVSLLTLTGLPDAAIDVLRPGRALIISDGVRNVRANLATVKTLGGGRAEVSLSLADSMAQMVRGDTTFRLNAVTIGHGESKGPKTLGSGDGEMMRQSFVLQVAEISHTASPVAESGVVPAIDVAVEGEVWPYADYIDPAADGTRSWSSTLGEDGFLTIHFRRRLPTGSGNVTLVRHRVGTGARGSGVPALSLTEPSKKHPHVVSVYQPFATSGGADREAVDSLRRTAPARLSSNGRAVSLSDFEKLAMRNAAVWRARAYEVTTARRTRLVRLGIVPAGGGPLTDQLKHDLGEALSPRILPGVSLGFEAYVPLFLRIHAEVRADLTSYDELDVQAACDSALRTQFALERRAFGQPAYISEAIAALEAVPGVATTIITRFDHGPGTPRVPPRVMLRDDQIVTIFPREGEVAHVGENASSAPVTGAPYISVNVRGLYE